MTWPYFLALVKGMLEEKAIDYHEAWKLSVDFCFSFNSFPPWPWIIGCQLLVNSPSICQFLIKVTFLFRLKSTYPVKWRKRYWEQGWDSTLRPTILWLGDLVQRVGRAGVPLVSQSMWRQNNFEGHVPRQPPNFQMSLQHAISLQNAMKFSSDSVSPGIKVPSGMAITELRSVWAEWCLDSLTSWGMASWFQCASAETTGSSL